MHPINLADKSCEEVEAEMEKFIAFSRGKTTHIHANYDRPPHSV